MTRCPYCGAQIIDATCHCGAEGRKMREPGSEDAADAAQAYEASDPQFFEAMREEHRDEDRRDEDRREAVAFSVAALLERMRLKPTAKNPRPMPSDHLPDGIPGPLASRFLSPPPYPDYREPPRSVTTYALRYMMARLRLIGHGLPVPSKWDSENGCDLSEREVFEFEVYVIRETSPAAERRRLEGDA